MSFPANPQIGDIFTNSGNKTQFQLTQKNVWKRITGTYSTGAGGISYTASLTAPILPKLGDQWFDENVQVLKSWAYDGQNYEWLPISAGQSTSDLYASISDIVLPLTWQYGPTNYAFELWSEKADYTWVDVDPVAVLSGINGNDSITVASTLNFKAGTQYVLYKEDGSFAQRIDTLSILNSTTIRLTNNITFDITPASNMLLGKTSFARHNGGAIVSNGDIYFSKFISPIPANGTGQLILRRTAGGAGTFNVSYRQSGSTTFTPMLLTQSLAVGMDYRDEYYDVPVSGSLKFQITYTGFGETVYFMVCLPKNQTVDANRVITPLNINPADQGINVNTTPTLVGSPYTSIYGLAQNGAEFRVASDQAFKNILLSSSTDFLSAFTAVVGQTVTVTDFVFYSGRKGVAVGAGGAIRLTSDGGNTITAGAAAASTSPDFKGVAYNGSNLIYAVGTGGALQYSTNFGSTFTAGNANDAFSGQLNGVAAIGNYAVAVGANGEILQTVNGGVIWNKVVADNSYTGTFQAVACDSLGNFIAVGSNGEIQTSNNYGATWQHRSNAGNYTGIFYAIAMIESGIALAVGSNAQIQYTSSYGANWSTKTADNSYTGTFYGVALNGLNALAVGTNGEIQSSKNGGLNFVHRTAAATETRTFNTAGITSDNYGIIWGATGALQKGVKIEGASTSYTAPAGSDLLAVNKLYYWQCRYQDSAGFWSSWSKPTIFATSATLNAVLQPSNLSPASGTTNASTHPILQISAFKTSGAADTQTASNYQVATDQAFSAIVYDSGDVQDFTSHTVTAVSLTVGPTYYWRARQKGTINGYSSFSLPTSFTVITKANTPVISTPAANSTVASANVTVATNNFSSPITGDTLQSTQFQFSTNLNFTNPIILIVNGATSVTTDNTTLSNNVQYFVRAATKGSLSSYSDWSTAIAFTIQVFTEYSVEYTNVGSQIITIPNGANYVTIESIAPGSACAVSGGSDSIGFGGIGGAYAKTTDFSTTGLTGLYLTVSGSSGNNIYGGGGGSPFPTVVRANDAAGTILNRAATVVNQSFGSYNRNIPAPASASIGDVIHTGGDGAQGTASGGGAGGPIRNGSGGTGGGFPAGNGAVSPSGGAPVAGNNYGGGAAGQVSSGAPGGQGWIKITWKSQPSLAVEYTTPGVQQIPIPAGFKTVTIESISSGAQSGFDGAANHPYGGAGGTYSKTVAYDISNVTTLCLTVPGITQGNSFGPATPQAARVQLNDINGTTINLAAAPFYNTALSNPRYMPAPVASSIGDIIFVGGAGSFPNASTVNVGGGGAGGPNGLGGAGGLNNITGNPGVGGGGKAGNGGGTTGTATYSTGFDGANYGGGGGQGSQATTPGVGAQGWIKLTFE